MVYEFRFLKQWQSINIRFIRFILFVDRYICAKGIVQNTSTEPVNLGYNNDE
jgi:hypothetical protein